MAYRRETPIPVKYMNITPSLFRRLVEEMISRQQDRLDDSSEPKVVWGHSFWTGPVYSRNSRNRRGKTIQIREAGYVRYSFMIWKYNNSWGIERSQPTLESDSLRSNRMDAIAPFSISGAQFYLQQTVSNESQNYISQCLHVLIWHS